jgi:hypothetical protein
MASNDFYLAFTGNVGQFAGLSRFFHRLTSTKAALAERPRGGGRAGWISLAAPSQRPAEDDPLDAIVRDPAWAALLPGETIEKLNARDRWGYYLADLWNVLNGDYRLVEVTFDGHAGRLVYDPRADSFGGTHSLKALIEAFGLEVTHDSFSERVAGWHRQIASSRDNAEKLLRQLRARQLGGRVTDRKGRLVVCACVREGLWHLLKDARSRAAVEVAERFADGRAAGDEWQAARDAAWATTWDLVAAPSAVARYYLAAAGAECGWELRPVGAAAPRFALDDLLAQLFADIVGPERLPGTDPRWLCWNDGAVVRIARGIYERRDFGLLPILGDALEDAGCDSQEIIKHCRLGGLHARGCWVLDLLLKAQYGWAR